jgi:choline dehydrogenase-like flavoprotein
MSLSASHRRRALGIAAAAAGGLSVLALTAATPAVASRYATAASVPACATSSLVIWLDTQGSGTAGSTYYNLEFANLSARACALFGYPGVSGFDLAGHQLGSAARRNPEHSATAVTIAAHATAHAVLRIVDASNYPTSTCAQTTAAGLRVYPPGQTAAKSVPYPFLACSRSGPGYLSVEAVQPGQGRLN